MNKKARKDIGSHMRYELREGEHTFKMCKCNRRGCRSEKCWECWLEVLEEGKEMPPVPIKQDASCMDKVEDNSFLQIGENCKLCGVKGVCHKMLAHHRLGKCVKCVEGEA